MNPNPPIHAVLFDYGLVLSGPPDPAAWLRMQQLTELSETDFHTAYWQPRLLYDNGTHTGAGYWAEVAGAPPSAETLEALFDADTDLWTAPNQPMIDWAARLQSAGVRTGILSNLGDRMSEDLLARLPWLSAFHHRVWSHTLRTAKHDAVMFQVSVAGLGIPAENILFVDDRADNIAGALAAGMQAIQYTSHAAFLAELHRRGLDDLWSQGNSTASQN